MPEGGKKGNMQGVKGHGPGGIKPGSHAAKHQSGTNGGNIPKNSAQSKAQSANAKNKG